MTKDEAPPFSYRVNVGHVAGNAVTVELSADEDERDDLAKFWAVSAVRSLDAELELSRWKRDGVRVAGKVRAVVEQPCVATLEPVEQHIEEDVSALFVPEGSKLTRLPDNGEVIVDAEGPDLPEPLSGDSIDVGAVVMEFVALAIDRYPRKPGVGYQDHLESGDDEAEGAPSPFATLKEWGKSSH